MHRSDHAMALNGPQKATPAADRRTLPKWTGALAGSAGIGVSAGRAQPPRQSEAASSQPDIAGVRQVGGLCKGMFSFMLASEQFTTPEVIRLGAQASRGGFEVLSTSDHLQPWQDNQGHMGQAWVTKGALGAQCRGWMGTTVTCPTLRYNPPWSRRRSRHWNSFTPAGFSWVSGPARH